MAYRINGGGIMKTHLAASAGGRKPNISVSGEEAKTKERKAPAASSAAARHRTGRTKKDAGARKLPDVTSENGGKWRSGQSEKCGRVALNGGRCAANRAGRGGVKKTSSGIRRQHAGDNSLGHRMTKNMGAEA